LVFLLLLHLLLIVHIGLIGHEEAWELIFKRAKRLQRLTNDILDVSRIETGQLSYRFEVYLHGTFSYIMKTNRKLKERAPVLDIGRYRVVGIITKDYKGIYSMVRMNNIL
jgi:signal transduction histidine kinase